MLTGFNTDFKYKGVVYHVQTEDNGKDNPVIVTLLYRGGAILASKKTSYADILKFEGLDKVIKELMENQHKQIIRDLVSSKFGQPDEIVDEPVPVEEEDIIEAEVIEAAEFGLDVITDKSLDEVILDYLSSEDD
jgi:hypothetical protein